MKHLCWLPLLVLSSCLSSSGEPQPGEPDGDPAKGEVSLPAANGWRAQLVLDVSPTGVWCVKPFDVFPRYAEQELVALDDLGRCWVLVSYGGRWTPFATGPEGSWLGTVTQGDVDPRVEGPELYAGAESGRVWEIVAHAREGVIDRRLVAQIDGRQIHSIVAADLDLERPGDELLVFTEPAELWQLTPRTDGIDGFDARLVMELDGRIRDAVVQPLDLEGPAGALLKPLAGKPIDSVLLASRAGWVGWLRDLSPAPDVHRLHELPFGRGRVALAPSSVERRSGAFAYSTAEDGTIWRHAWKRASAEVQSERIHAGPQGPRGIAAGRFSDDPERETVAVFGYSGRVELLTRPESGAGPWEVETIFTDLAAGHWLSTAELDGRNATDELVLCGYSGRVVLLARPPGYGTEDAARAPR